MILAGCEGDPVALDRGFSSGPPSEAAPAPGSEADGAAVAESVRAAVADGAITSAEWAPIRAQLQDGPPVASLATRLVLDAWADEGLDIEPAARTSMVETLRAFGYDVPAERPAGAEDLVAQFIAGNVTEPDAEYARIAALAGRQGQETVIAVVDTGCEVTHPALRDKLWTNPGEVPGDGVDNDQNGMVDDVHGWDFMQGDGDVEGPDHGTHVTGVATRGTDTVQSISCKVVDQGVVIGLGPRVASAIDYAAGQGARVVNISLGGWDAGSVPQVMAAMVRHADVLFVVAAGNEDGPLGTGSLARQTFLPANQLPNMAVVSASSPFGWRWTGEDSILGSNYLAPFSTHAARGQDVYAPVRGRRYQRMTGTSMAAPDVAGLAARCLGLDPLLRPEQVKGIIADTSSHRCDWDTDTLARGIIDPASAYRVAALTGLMRAGRSAAAAAAELELGAEDRDRLIEIAERHLLGLPGGGVTIVAPAIPEEGEADFSQFAPGVIREVDDVQLRGFIGGTEYVIRPAGETASVSVVVNGCFGPARDLAPGERTDLARLIEGIVEQLPPSRNSFLYSELLSALR